MLDHDPNDADLARWLQEAGRRRVARKPEQRLPDVIGAPDPAKPVPAPAETKSPERYIRHPRVLLLFTVAALSYLPYFYADVSVQISSLPRVIVFV